MAKVSLRAYNREIETMTERGQVDEAIAHCHHIFKTFPKHLETYRLLGKIYLETKRYKDAVDIFSRVLVSEPNDFVANVGMSIIRDEENKLDDAIWHMERAFETQPSNAAIQGELQRLYGRRDGVQPPRIRMTRGALAHMYVQGELYPQAISEIKSVLKEDPGRSDMQALLARACYRSGLKNEAAEAASGILRRYPYCLDANRVLAEIFGAEHPENAQVYRQRVVELDPYAAQVTGTIFQSNEVLDAAIGLEHLDWNGQPVGTQPDWRAEQAISLESGAARNEQPDWLKNSYADTLPPTSPSPTRPFDPTQGGIAPVSGALPALGMSASPPPADQAAPADDIPDFLRAAGWGQSTGAFDESKPIFGNEESTAPAQPIAQGDMPDWVKAMAPTEAAPPPAEEEALPDWINKIGTGKLSPSPASDSGGESDWMSQLGRASEPVSSGQTTDNNLDWMGQLGQPSQPAPVEQQQHLDDSPDWMKQFDQPASSAPVSNNQPDWMKQFDEPASSPASNDQADWMSQLDQPAAAPALNSIPSTPAPASMMDTGSVNDQERDDSFAWLENLAAKQGATEGLLTKPEDRLEIEPDWVKQAKDLGASAPSSFVPPPAAPPPLQEMPPVYEQPPTFEQQQPAAPPPIPQPSGNLEELGKSDQERDDSFAWLENLAAKQGATEGLLTKPEDRLETEPDWVKQAKDLGAAAPSSFAPPPAAPPPIQEIPSVYEQPPSFEQPPAPAVPSPMLQPSGNLEELGKSDQERDDSFAWLENLAAKQGATEGLLTKPEDRLEKEPDWVKQAKDLGAAQPPAQLAQQPETVDDTAAWLRSLDEEESKPAPVAAPASDDTAMWLKNLDEEESKPAPVPMPASDDTAMWLKNLDEEESKPAPVPMPASDDTAMWLKNLDEEESKPAPVPMPASDDTAMWLKRLDEEESKPASASANDDTAMWLKSLDEAEAVPQTPQASAAGSELPNWMQNIEQEKAQAAEPVISTSDIGAGKGQKEAAGESDWTSSIEEPAPQSFDAPKTETGSLPSWLRGLDKEEPQESTSAPQEDLPAWLRDESGEALAEPTKIEPTRATDWQPAQPKPPKPAAPEPARVLELQPAQEKPPEPPPPAPHPAIEEPRSRPVKKAAPKPETPVPAYIEPVTRKGTGMLTMPVDPILGSARNELSRSNIPGALETYGKLIKKARFLDEVIFDLREALYRYPVEVSIWQSLGDAYMRANRLQDALDAYTKAEELLR